MRKVPKGTKPCPFCGGVEVVSDGDENLYECYVQCRNCEATGPTAANHEVAISKWQQCPRRA